MRTRHALLGAVLLAVAVVAVALGATGAGITDAPGTSTAPMATSAETVGAAPSSTGPSAIGQASRDATVAFWEERLAGGGGYETTLHLVDALIERARASGTLSDLERAADLLDAVAPTASVGEVDFPLRRGRIAFALHDFRGAREAAETALVIDPSEPAALALSADASLELGEVDAADEAYARLAAGEAARRPPVISRLARRAWLGGDTVLAETLVRDAIRGASIAATGDENAFYNYQLGEMLRARNALAEAEDAYRAALEAQPDHVPSMGGLALVLAAGGDRDAAVRLLEAATARLPAPDLVAALGDLYAIAGRDSDAADQWALVERIAEIGEANGGVYDRQLVLFLADHDRDPDRAVALAEAELATAGRRLRVRRPRLGAVQGRPAHRGRCRGGRGSPTRDPRRPDPLSRRADRRCAGPHRGRAPAPRVRGVAQRGAPAVAGCSAARGAGAHRSMTEHGRRRLVPATFVLAAGLLAVNAGTASAHPLGNFTVNRAIAIEVGATVEVAALLDMAEIPAYEVIRDLDIDGDDAVSPAEGATWAVETCATWRDAIAVSLDGEPASLRNAGADAPRLTFPAGAGGLPTLRLECRFALDGVIAAARTDRAARRDER